jgi:transcriptional accessory protein Tex/SPT6
MIYIQKLKAMRKPLISRISIYEEGILHNSCFRSSSGFTKVRIPIEKSRDHYQYNCLDQTRIHPSNYESVYAIVTDVLGDNSPDAGKKIVNDLIADPERLAALAKSEVIRE